ncbi:ABC transporter ATP-binding protein [Pseudonocardia sp. RS010]|uniref:ABC transporter ATP-binding protein n=1 Tax=Pseudonocardia sp. RS010 TaxID=3385979 RepID=UPI00399FFB1C
MNAPAPVEPTGDTTSDWALELTDVHATIGVSHILQGVTLRVPRNTVTAMLGRNGVGKTTTLRAVLGLVPRTGSILLDGVPIERETTPRIVRRGIGYVPEDRDVFGGLTVQENLRLAERKGGEHHYDRVFELFPELRKRARQHAGTLSGGQQQMVSLGRGLLNDNRVLLIDEPTKGLAPKLVSEVVEVLERVRSVATILLVEQNIAAAHRLAGHVVAMTEGRVEAQGPADELLADDQRVRELLGVTDSHREERH